MPGNSTNWVDLATQSPEPYIAVAISAVRLDSRPPVALYIDPGTGEPPVLYAASNTPFTVEQRQRLEQNRITQLLIKTEDQASFRRYVEWHIADVLFDDTISTGDKSRIVHFTARSLVEELLANPEADEGFRRSGAMIENTVDFLFRNAEAARYLITAASFSYDAYAHSVNTTVYALAFAQKMGMRRLDSLLDFGLAVLLRDIGLSRVDPGNWDSERAMDLAQFDAYKQHPVISEHILKESGLVSSDALHMVRHHHERMSGHGFPDGLGGHELSEHARMVCIADTFDSLTTNRDHRSGHSTYTALRIMSTDSRQDYDQDLLRAFVELMGNPG